MMWGYSCVRCEHARINRSFVLLLFEIFWTMSSEMFDSSCNPGISQNPSNPSFILGTLKLKSQSNPTSTSVNTDAPNYMISVKKKNSVFSARHPVFASPLSTMQRRPDRPSTSCFHLPCRFCSVPPSASHSPQRTAGSHEFGGRQGLSSHVLSADHRRCGNRSEDVPSSRVRLESCRVSFIRFIMRWTVRWTST